MAAEPTERPQADVDLLACGLSPASARDLCDPDPYEERRDAEDRRWMRGDYDYYERFAMGEV